MPISAEALFNAVKKQYGLHSYLLPLSIPTVQTPDPVPIPFPAPRLPSLSSTDASPIPPSQLTSNGLTTPTPYAPSKSPIPYSETPSALTANMSNRQSITSSQVNSLYLTENDISNIGRFTREFVVMSMIPWMEKCVADWNESVGSISLFAMILSNTIDSSHRPAGYLLVYFLRRVVCLAQDILEQVVLPHLHTDIIPRYHRCHLEELTDLTHLSVHWHLYPQLAAVLVW